MNLPAEVDWNEVDMGELAKKYSFKQAGPSDSPSAAYPLKLSTINQRSQALVFIVENQQIIGCGTILKYQNSYFVLTAAHVLEGTDFLFVYKHEKKFKRLEHKGTLVFSKSLPDSDHRAVTMKKLDLALVHVGTPSEKVVPLTVDCFAQKSELEQTKALWLLHYFRNSICISQATFSNDIKIPNSKRSTVGFDYLIYTEGGTSGAPIFSCSGKLIGIHLRGPPKNERFHGTRIGLRIALGSLAFRKIFDTIEIFVNRAMDDDDSVSSG
mmetsp:Transcript_18772/g.27965  ORF Transcript_18772/g.27965 Transcript_18772/m.27965 type:complete len:268 (-) Transcript_18772:266-1069(-)